MHLSSGQVTASVLHQTLRQYHQTLVTVHNSRVHSNGSRHSSTRVLRRRFSTSRGRRRATYSLHKFLPIDTRNTPSMRTHHKRRTNRRTSTRSNRQRTNYRRHRARTRNRNISTTHRNRQRRILPIRLHNLLNILHILLMYLVRRITTSRHRRARSSPVVRYNCVHTRYKNHMVPRCRRRNLKTTRPRHQSSNVPKSCTKSNRPLTSKSNRHVRNSKSKGRRNLGSCHGRSIVRNSSPRLRAVNLSRHSRAPPAPD